MLAVVVDYGMGNLRSVAKAIEHIAPDIKVLISSEPADVMRADRVVVPGQGAMPDCMREFMARGLHDAVLKAAASKPFLGICVGMQMLFEHSAEGDTPGLGILPGKVLRFREDMTDASGAKLKVPHMGWNQVEPQPEVLNDHVLWQNIHSADNPDAAPERFYFVHSYYCVPQNDASIAAQTCYGQPFTCAVLRDNIFAVQFHPEKSARAGLQLLANFMTWNP